MKPKTLIHFISGLLSLLISGETLTPQSAIGLDATPVGVARLTNISLGEGYVTGTELVEARITVVEVVRGGKAWDLVKAASSSNKPAGSGFEYVAARIKFELGGKEGGGDQTYAVRDEQFASVSGSGNQYYTPSITQPKPPLGGRLYSGEFVEGWIAFAVAVDDAKPLMSFGNNYRRVWFLLY